MGWAGQQIGALGTVIPTLVMVIGLSDAVHLLLETKRQLAVGKTRDQAIIYLQQREAEITNQLTQTEAELRAAMDGLRDDRREAEEMRTYIERNQNAG